jgi:hypothetical protein
MEATVVMKFVGQRGGSEILYRGSCRKVCLNVDLVNSKRNVGCQLIFKSQGSDRSHHLAWMRLELGLC